MRTVIRAPLTFLPPDDVSGASGAMATLLLLLLVFMIALMARTTIADAVVSAADRFAHFRVWGAENPIEGSDSNGDSPTVHPPVYDASVVSVDLPGQMTQGASYNAVIEMRNTGIAPWAANGASPVKLGAVGGDRGDTYRFAGAASFLMDGGTVVRRGEIYKFQFNVVAPEPGLYNPAFRMTKDWYGEFGETASKSIRVVTAATATPAPTAEPTAEPTSPPYDAYVAYGKFILFDVRGNQLTGGPWGWCYDGPFGDHNQRSSYFNEPQWPHPDWDIGGPNGHYEIYSDYFTGSMSFDMNNGGFKGTVVFRLK